MTTKAAERLGLSRLVPEGDALDFEHLWRIMAAGGDAEGARSESVLCRAIGAFRHSVAELPVYGRASATVELAADAKLSAISFSCRRYAGDEGMKSVAAKVRRPDEAAGEVAARLVRAFGGLEQLRSTRVQAEWFRFGYLSLGRRHSQAVLAPFYIASIGLEHEFEASAHVIAVTGSEEQFVRLPPGRRTTARSRALQPA
jgi:hypothetical protein